MRLQGRSGAENQSWAQASRTKTRLEREDDAQVDGDGASEQLGEVGEDDADLCHDVERVQETPPVHELVPRVAVVQREPAVRREVCGREVDPSATACMLQRRPALGCTLHAGSGRARQRERTSRRTIVGHAAEPGRQELEEEGDEAREEDDEEVAVAELQAREGLGVSARTGRRKPGEADAGRGGGRTWEPAARSVLQLPGSR